MYGMSSAVRIFVLQFVRSKINR